MFHLDEIYSRGEKDDIFLQNEILRLESIQSNTLFKKMLVPTTFLTIF